MGWWFDLARRNDYQRRIEAMGVTDLTVSVTKEEGLLVRIASWKEKRNWTHRHRTEMQLGPDGLAAPSDDRFVAPFTEETDLQSPTGRHLAFICTGQLQFLPIEDDATDVLSSHHHSLTGGNWLHRRQIWKSDLQAQPRLYTDQCDRCEADLRSTS